jgi:ArsR family transcriptional regulator, cadmium/lead-responsive transcriptional repressor
LSRPGRSGKDWIPAAPPARPVRRGGTCKLFAVLLLGVTVLALAAPVDAGDPGQPLDSIYPKLYCQGMAVSSAVDLEVLHRIGTALADPTRRRIIVQLLDGPAYPADLADSFGTTRANLSNHLTCLRDCGLVTATAEGRRIRYDLADPRFGDALRLLASLDLPGTCDT